MISAHLVKALTIAYCINPEKTEKTDTRKKLSNNLTFKKNLS